MQQECRAARIIEVRRPVPGGAHPRAAVKGIDFDAGVVSEREEATGACVGNGLQRGVGFVGIAILLDLDCEAAPVQAPATAAGFEILRWNLTLEGRCPACRSRLA